MKIAQSWSLAALLLALASCRATHAATYYCDPVAGTTGGDGSAQAPWPKLEDAIKSGKLRQLQGGDTLLLLDGNHGVAKFSGDNATIVTIAAGYGQKPQLGRLEVPQGSNWLFKGLTISPAFAPAPYWQSIVMLGDGGPSHDITLQDCFIYTARDASQWTAAEWMKASNGIMTGRNGTHIDLRNNYVLNTRFGIQLCAPDSVCESNVVSNFSGDGMRITRDDITVEDNVVKNSYVGAADGDGNHDDLIQCFLFNKGTGTVKNAKVIGNILIGNEDPAQPFLSSPQGLGFFDGPLVDFDIERNVIVSNIYHGIALYDAVDCKILDNSVKAAFAQKMMPWIMLGTKNKGGSHGNVVKNNMACSFVFKDDPDVVTENNVSVADAVFQKRMEDQLKLINDKFGATLPVADLPRLVLKKAAAKEEAKKDAQVALTQP